MVCSLVERFQHLGGLATTNKYILEDPVMLIFTPFFNPTDRLQTTYLPMLCFTLLRWKMTHPAKSELICKLYFYNNKIIVKLAFIGVNKLWTDVYGFPATNYHHNMQVYCSVIK
jgi:hypothetical protein